MPKKMPVRMLASPEKTRVEEGEIRLSRVRAAKMGKNVSMSPKAPEISRRGRERRVEVLWAWVRRR